MSLYSELKVFFRLVNNRSDNVNGRKSATLYYRLHICHVYQINLFSIVIATNVITIL
jgi:hypothetical protein